MSTSVAGPFPVAGNSGDSEVVVGGRPVSTLVADASVELGAEVSLTELLDASDAVVLVDDAGTVVVA